MSTYYRVKAERKSPPSVKYFAYIFVFEKWVFYTSVMGYESTYSTLVHKHLLNTLAATLTALSVQQG